MPDTTLPNLTESTSRALTDLAYIVKDPSGTPLSRKMSLTNLLRESATELTISSGAVTFTQLNHKLQPQSGTADDLDTINGTTDGQGGVIYVTDFGTDTITIKHNTGNILCVGDADIALSNGCVTWFSNGTKVFVSGGGRSHAASDITSGTLDNARLDTSVVVRNADGNIFVGDTYVIPDDSFASIPLDTVGDLYMFLVQMRSGATTTNYGIGNCKAQAASVCDGYLLGSNTNVTTGALTGTTGTDGRTTISVHTNGNFYVENRTGASRNYTVKIW